MTKHWQDSFSEWLKKFFVDEEHNRNIEEYQKKQFFLRRIAEEGYSYDNDNEWWQRKWSTNNDKESILEIYQELENGSWKKLMIGYGDRVFFEEEVSESTQE